MGKARLGRPAGMCRPSLFDRPWTSIFGEPMRPQLRAAPILTELNLWGTDAAPISCGADLDRAQSLGNRCGAKFVRHRSLHLLGGPSAVSGERVHEIQAVFYKLFITSRRAAHWKRREVQGRRPLVTMKPTWTRSPFGKDKRNSEEVNVKSVQMNELILTSCSTSAHVWRAFPLLGPCTVRGNVEKYDSILLHKFAPPPT